MADTRAVDVHAAFREHGPALLGFATNALRDQVAAEDCLQETFLRAWRSRSQFDGSRGSVRTWLFAIERNVIADLLRSRHRQPRAVEDVAVVERVSIDADPLTRLGIVEALATLTDDHREAVVAVHISGMSYSEYSEVCGVPVATLRTRVFYGLRAMRTHLDELDQVDD
jgi:RNA polymerase sigma-70 factor, ECF subfamily